MRAILIVSIAASGLAVMSPAPANAVNTRYAFCMQGQEYPSFTGCQFSNYEQCQASASGRYLTCIQNPYFNPGRDPRANRQRGRPVYGDQF